MGSASETSSSAIMLVERTKRIRLEMFEYSVLVVLTSSIQGSCKKHEKEFEAPIDADDCAGLHVWHPEKPLSMIVLEFDPEVRVVAHEAFHVVWRVMEWTGAKHENEIMAYMVGHLTEQVMKFAIKTGKPDIPPVPQYVLDKLKEADVQKRLDSGQAVNIPKPEDEQGVVVDIELDDRNAYRADR